MMSPDDRALEDLLYNSDLGDDAEGAEPGGSPPGLQEPAAADSVSMTGPRFTAALRLLFVACSTIKHVLIQWEEVRSRGHLYSCLCSDWSDVLLRCVSVSDSHSRVHPGARDVCWLRRAGVRSLLPIGRRQGVAQRLPPL